MDENPYEPSLVPKLKSRLAKRGNSPILKWIAPKLKKSQAFSTSVYVVQLSADAEIGTPKYDRVEEQLSEKGARIIEKHSNRFEDTLIVDTDNNGIGNIELLRSIDGVDIVYPRPIPKALGVTKQLKNGLTGNINDVGDACSKSETRNQVSILDHITAPFANIKNRGEGVHIVVWDFLPKDRKKFAQNPDMLNRAGGPPTIYDDETASEDMHGGAVCSTCCGSGVGLAPASKLSIIGLTSSVTGDLSIIDEICKDANGGAVIVNMSFALEFQNVKEQDIPDAKKSMDTLTAAMDTLKAMHPKLVFVVAAGNESLNPCDTKGPVSFSGCKDCLMWPQSRYGEAYGWKDVPFVLVGATDAAKNQGGNREIASFSNFGKCVHVFAHGSPVCSLDTSKGGDYVAIAGTSFSSPLFASMLALYFSAKPDSTADQAVGYMIENAEKGTIKFTRDSQDSLNRFAIVPTELNAGKIEKTPIISFLESGMEKGNIHTIMTILLIIFAVFFVFYIFRKRSTDKQKNILKNTRPAPTF